MVQWGACLCFTSSIHAVSCGFGGKDVSRSHVDVIVQIGIIGAWILAWSIGSLAAHDTQDEALAVAKLRSTGRARGPSPHRHLTPHGARYNTGLISYEEGIDATQVDFCDGRLDLCFCAG
jgi:hypothetical protein